MSAALLQWDWTPGRRERFAWSASVAQSSAELEPEVGGAKAPPPQGVADCVTFLVEAGLRSCGGGASAPPDHPQSLFLERRGRFDRERSSRREETAAEPDSDE
jgi:hypothetical protein